MSLIGMPLLILNLGGEMVYILDQVRFSISRFSFAKGEIVDAAARRRLGTD